MKRVTAMIAVALTCALVLPAMAAEPKMTIKEVMKLHKEGLHKKFQEGTATKEEAAKLLAAYEEMAKNKPPKGDDASWKSLNDALIAATKAGDKDAFKKAVGCAGCHGPHKP